MTVVYRVTPALRTKFKEPFGDLIQGTAMETMAKLKEIVAVEKPSRIISVGDVVSRNLHEHKLHPQLTIIDNKFLRNQSAPQEGYVDKTVTVSNPQGTITEEAIATIKEALENNQHTHIVVEGEEDLLTLIAVLFAPQNSFVIYGQPYSGVVVVKVSAEKKALAQQFLNEMKATKS
ncbi:MAG: DUF359 domain-containing protein [Candidatus Bathyarchaeota archaeon]|nr:DUF359 domain-containing protein [Candidatus Bathyarchaeota archaeon]